MILFLDTETNGNITKYNRPASSDDTHPRIVQLGYSLYDYRSREVISASQLIIPENLSKRWDPKAFKIHGITKEKARTEGIQLKDALLILNSMARYVDFVVCHNVDFDRPVLQSEYIRVFDQSSEDLFSLNTPWICTMKMTTPILQIPHPRRNGLKWPSMSELYYFVFNERMTGAHDAGRDVKALADCFFGLCEKELIRIPDHIFDETTHKDFLITQIT